MNTPQKPTREATGARIRRIEVPQCSGWQAPVLCECGFEGTRQPREPLGGAAGVPASSAPRPPRCLITRGGPTTLSPQALPLPLSCAVLAADLEVELGTVDRGTACALDCHYLGTPDWSRDPQRIDFDSGLTSQSTPGLVQTIRRAATDVTAIPRYPDWQPMPLWSRSSSYWSLPVTVTGFLSAGMSEQLRSLTIGRQGL